ncbi:F0F1 ATP synthase subunit B [Nocardia brasiliensis]|uniref:F0F1 ATP synthase subunit B family protein n=1 Tax=Nocardia brasiliensis TaxID=37326 RepID=UPI00189546CE|nr:F0F1 ATP synthase subunit B [Nocardia brasiliensis]MBF6543593.1 F0F1 ATP synthase subunit B [Nocardia brasiliensis]
MSTKNTAGENFLLPNGTFFAELLIFVTVLGVIWRFVIPPINRAMEEREARVAKTEADERTAAALRAEVDQRYRSALAEAEGAAAAIRKQARAQGRSLIAQRKAGAQEEADAMVAQAAIELRAEAERIGAQLHDSVEPLARTLADRVIADPAQVGRR